MCDSRYCNHASTAVDMPQAIQQMHQWFLENPAPVMEPHWQFLPWGDWYEIPDSLLVEYYEHGVLAMTIVPPDLYTRLQRVVREFRQIDAIEAVVE